MKRASSVWAANVSLIIALSGTSFAESYFEGKVAKGSKDEVQIGMVRWGSNPVGEDRVTGKIRRYDITESSTVREQLAQEIVVTMDVFNPKRELMKSVQLSFDMLKYGYRKKRNHYEAAFCVDFEKIDGARKIKLANVAVAGKSKVYRTFNISSDIMKTNFKLSEPKVIPIKQ